MGITYARAECEIAKDGNDFIGGGGAANGRSNNGVHVANRGLGGSSIIVIDHPGTESGPPAAETRINRSIVVSGCV
jgi:hypothetical protein